MSVGDSMVKRKRSCTVQVMTVGLLAIAGVNGDQIQAAEPVRSLEVSSVNPSPTVPTRLYVNPELGDNWRGDGSRDRPFQTLTHALDQAHPNTIIVLAPGTYSEASGEQFPIQLRSGVTVYGDPDQWGEDIEIVGGGWLMTPTAGEQSVTILGFDGAGLSGVTVRNPDGSAIWVAGGMPWIVGNTIAENDRHGIVAHDGTPYIVNNRFDDNDGSDLEFSDRATPQLQDNQLDRRNGRSIGYFVTATRQTITATNPANPANPVSQSPTVQTTPPISSQAQTQAQPQPQRLARAVPIEADDAAEILTWQGETSFPPLVRPSETIAARSEVRPNPRPAESFDRTTAQSLPLDPDLASALNLAREEVNLEVNLTDQRTPRRGSTIAESGEYGIAPPGRIPSTVRNPFEASASPRVSNTGLIVPSPSPSLPVRSSTQRLPAVPNVPNVPNVPAVSNPQTVPSVPREHSEVISPPIVASSTPTHRNTTAPIVAWGTPTGSSTPTATTPDASPANTPETLLRWEALERSTPVASSGLPAPIVNPNRNTPTQPSLNSNTRPTSIIIAGQSAEPPDTTATNTTNTTNVPPAQGRTPIPIQASVEPFDRASLPLAYAPSNITPAWPQPRPTGIPGLVPLPVPDPNPPIGEGGALPPPPSSTVNPSEIPPGLVPGITQGMTQGMTQTGVRYRVLVNGSAGLEQVAAIADSAFVTQNDGREVIQAGVFRDSWRADQLVGELTAVGLTAWVVEF